jgi:hypothetical protein
VSLTVEQNKLKNYFYTASVSLIINNEETTCDSNFIENISFEYDFNNNFFPILHLKLYVTHKVAYNIRQNMKNLLVKIKLTVNSITISNTKNINYTELNSILSKSSTEVFIDNVLFQPFNTDTNYYTRQDNTNATAISYNSYSDDLSNPELMELYLFSKDSLNKNKTIINAILSDCQVIDGVGYALKAAGIDNALVSYPSNISTFKEENNEELILPPLNFKSTIESLQNIYGIYKLGLIQFLDINAYYLINKDYTRKLPVEKNDYEKVFINVLSDIDVTLNKVGCYKDTKNKCYVINTTDTTDITDNSDLVKEGYGSNYQVMSRESIKDSVTYDATTDTFTFSTPYNTYNTGIGTSENTTDKTKMLYNDTNNSYLETSTINNLIESTIIISMDFSNLDVSMFKLNKKYIFQFQNTAKDKYNGVYRLTYYTYSIKLNEFYIAAVFYKIMDL